MAQGARGSNWERNRACKDHQAELRRNCWTNATPGETPALCKRKAKKRTAQRARAAEKKELLNEETERKELPEAAERKETEQPADELQDQPMPQADEQLPVPPPPAEQLPVPPPWPAEEPMQIPVQEASAAPMLPDQAEIPTSKKKPATKSALANGWPMDEATRSIGSADAARPMDEDTRSIGSADAEKATICADLVDV
jgi:hypothetical protein